MTNKHEKCPNCGHLFKDGEKYCPNCDLFVPIDEQENSENGFNSTETRSFNKFNEDEIKKQNEPESLFKHRTRTPDDDAENKAPEQSNEKEKNQLISKKQEDIKEDSPLSSAQINNSSNVEEDKFNKSQKLHESDNDEAKDNSHLVVNHDDKPSQPQNNNKKKWLIGIIVVIIIIAIGYGFFYSNHQKKLVEADRVTLVSETTDYIDNLYLTKDHDYLKSGITQTDMNKAKESLNKLKTKEGYEALKEEYDVAEDKFNKQEAVNALFNKPILEGDQLDDSVYVKDATGVSLNKVTKETDGFDKLYNQALDIATKQKEELKQVENKVAVVYKDDKVVNSATREEYDAAKEAVDALKNEELKKTYNEDLEKVNSFLTEKEEKEAADTAAREEEEKKAAALLEEQEAANSSTDNSSTDSSSTTTVPEKGTSNQRWGNREDATIDLSDPAWEWNPGIQNEVITEVIKRGYVVDGGYTLVPKYIENGVGFYDLYATTNSKIFPNSKPSEFPLFVVTIDDKTGSFYGNGPN